MKLSNKQIKFLETYVTGHWTVNDDMSISVTGNVSLIGNDETKNFQGKYIPVNFREITEDFVVSYSKIVSLKGSPQTVGRDFRMFQCENIKSFEFAPKLVKRDMTCSFSNIENLDHVPLVRRNIRLNCCTGLKTLKGLKHTTGKLNYRGVPISVDEKLIVEDKALLKKWLKSKLSVQEFSLARRGAISGKKFGF